jgi:hypothetical protein
MVNLPPYLPIQANKFLISGGLGSTTWRLVFEQCAPANPQVDAAVSGMILRLQRPPNKKYPRDKE